MRAAIAVLGPMSSPAFPSSLPSPEDIDFCLNVLRRLKPGDLGFLTKEFTAAGHALFKKSIKSELFGEQDVVSFLKQKEDDRSLLKKLEKVHAEVERSHAEHVEVSCHSFDMKYCGRLSQYRIQNGHSLHAGCELCWYQ